MQAKVLPEIRKTVIMNKIHHRQCLMSLLSLHSDDPGYSQIIMDRVMNGRDHFVMVRTWCEHQQRWLVNQQFAKNVLAMMACTTGLGVICLIAWLLYFANYSHSSWKSCAGKEIATWLSMPAIVLGFHYESELGDYFEEVYAWHNQTGPHNDHSSFHMMELHDPYFEFKLP